ncbi:MAG: hypothetical protein IKJ99_05870 [Oscillospiraceae bacterium]|nr:hypothetical protein [Oscillospiraceae bacterium]
MSEFKTQLYSGRVYSSEETISFSKSPLTHFADVDKEMQFHQNVSHVQVSNLTQSEFDKFVSEYGDRFKSIYFFQNTLVKDLSALGKLQNVEYLLFYNMRAAKSFWNMNNNHSLKGIFMSASKKMCYDLSPLPSAPSLEEVLLFGTMDRKYTVKSLGPLKDCENLKRVMLECNTEDHQFEPEDFLHLEVLKYRVDKHRNYSY